MTLKSRVLIVLRGAPRPLSTPEVARILGLPTQQVTSPLARLVAYGQVEIADHRQVEGKQRRLYRPKAAA